MFVRSQNNISRHFGRCISVKNVGYRFYASDVPSHIKVALPALSPTMETGTIVEWSKKEGDVTVYLLTWLVLKSINFLHCAGDQLNEGDKLAEIQTDKTVMDFETPEAGYLAKIMVPAGQKDTPVGKVLAHYTMH